MTGASVMQPLSDRKFRFACHKALPCFTRCCADLDLVLTSYDIIRLKNRLHLLSGEFLERYTVVYADRLSGLPVVKLQMRTNNTRQCPFLSPQGCLVYEDRPGACRLYPLGRAASKISNGRSGEIYFTVKESHCLGWNEEKEWTIQEWLTDQGLDEYNTMNDGFLDITTGRPPKIFKKLSRRHLQMVYLACFDPDGFRKFIFESSFIDRFDIDEALLARIRVEDMDLMAFAYRWLKFSLFGEMTFKIRAHSCG
ncbi:MAG: YkgJ family cysteine cluster protein [Desulfobacterales bacterium]|nr:YkgJ family cysteine cluster protein [Desulfobacterales bacterium]